MEERVAISSWNRPWSWIFW